MKKLAMSAFGLGAIALGLAPATRAAEPDDIGLDFSYPPVEDASPVAAAVVEASPSAKASQGVGPLSIPMGGTSIPSGKADASKAMMELPPPPPVVAEEPAAIEPAPVIVSAPPAPTVSNRAVSLQFESDPVANLPAAEPAAAVDPFSSDKPVEIAPAPVATAAPDLDTLFAGNTDSLIARAIGAAEGTRTPDGQKTAAYRGHKDPGNGKWNQGTFSYQHEAKSPEDADQRQLTRLRKQAETLQQQANAHGLQLSLEEQLNALDLANQSPRAALSQGGYIDRLKQARDMGLQGSEAVLWARTRAFLDPKTQRWNAPGLGNTVERITADQQRRQRAIARAIEAKGVATQVVAQLPPSSAPADQQTSAQQLDDVVGRIISFDLS